MIETYRPSGRFRLGTLLLTPAAMLAMVCAGFVYFLALKWIPLIYVNGLITVGIGALAGFIGGSAVRLGHCRNTMAAIVIGLLLGATGLLAKFGFQYRDYSQRIAELVAEEQDVPEQDAQQLIDATFSFTDFLQFRTEEGWNIGRAGRDGTPISGPFVWLFWAIEAGVILYFAVFNPRDVARAPYNEELSTWASEEEDLATIPVYPEVVNTTKRVIDLDVLLKPPKATEENEGHFLHYSIKSIPGEEMEAAYLSIQHIEVTVNKKGETSTTKKDLWNYVALTPEQRELITRNLQNTSGATA